MATEVFRKNFLTAYRETREPDMFLAGMFDVRPENISSAEKVAIDIIREDEEISPVVHLLEGPTANTDTQFTTKEFTPPSIQESMPFDVSEFLKRLPGQTEYDAANTSYQAAFVSKLLSGLRRLEGKIKRNREWQASQILRTGVLNLVNSAGVVVYTIDFLAKASHFTTVSNAWGGGSEDILGDLEAGADLVREDSLQDADRVLLGSASLKQFLGNSNVQQHLDNRRMEIGQIAPAPRGNGGKFIGVIHVGSYELEIWTYNGRGIPPGGTKTKFLQPNDCIIQASSGRLDTLFGGVPQVVPIDSRFADFLPERVSLPQAVDLSPNLYATQNGRQMILELFSRPLLVPTAIDSWVKLDTQSS